VTAEKVQIVENNAQTYGLNVTLDAIGLPKSTWYYWKNRKVQAEEKHAHLRRPVIEILRENPTTATGAFCPTSTRWDIQSGRRYCGVCFGCGICHCTSGLASQDRQSRGGFSPRTVTE